MCTLWANGLRWARPILRSSTSFGDMLAANAHSSCAASWLGPSAAIVADASSIAGLMSPIASTWLHVALAGSVGVPDLARSEVHCHRYRCGVVYFWYGQFRT